MRCNHCGQCCKDQCTQINVTLGDIYRISKFLGIPAVELLKDKIGINPFADSDIIHYDLDLGLNLPCKFRVDNKCSIYSARPLNCRLFPYWILVEAPSQKIKEILDEHKCSYDFLRKKEYAEYKEAVADILLQENKIFEIKKKINASRLKGYEEIKEEDFRAKEEKKIMLIKERAREKIDIGQMQKLIEENKELFWRNKEKLDEAEKILQ